MASLLSAGSPTWSKKIPVHGQGVFTFNIKRDNEFYIVMKNGSSDITKDMIYLHVGEDIATFELKLNGEQQILSTTTQAMCGYVPGKKIAYWFSYDRDRLVLKYGKGYRMEETTWLVHDFLADKTPTEQEQIRKEYYPFFNAEHEGYVELYDVTSGKVQYSIIDVELPVEFEKNPFICNLSPFVRDSDYVSLFILDNNDYMLSGSLPPACKELYQNIRNCELNWPEEVDDVLLSDSIRYSIETKGCLLYDKLEEKKSEFGPDSPKETYLRVTLGQSLGNSPGVPYVLEIWPSGHFSPIHNHGNANAVIKVLFGSIHIKIFNKNTQAKDAKPLKEFDARNGDVTWINRNWYQTHQLKNITDDFCATIQCYSYDAGDTIHWPYFDYISENCTIDEFFPNSDFTFGDMRRKVMDEFRNKHSTDRSNGRHSDRRQPSPDVTPPTKRHRVRGGSAGQRRSNKTKLP